MRKIEIISRALILKKNKILLCKSKRGRHYFLPGGHLNFGESAGKALSRELKEELGVKSEVGPLIGACEHIYRKKSGKHHEINLVFKVKLRKIDLNGKEKEIKFYLEDLEEFKKNLFSAKKFKKNFNFLSQKQKVLPEKF